MTSYFQQALSSFQETFELKGEVGRMVDEATAEDLMVADVNTNRAICRKCADMSTECGSALRVIRSRLQHRSPKVQLLALQLLSEIVCKSGREAHAQVSEKDGPLSDLKHLAVAPGTEAAVRKKALLLIRAWGDTPDGGGNGGAETRLFRETYNSLVSQGISFPAFDASLAPGRDSPVSRPVSSIPQHSALTASPTRGHGQPARNPGGGGGYGGPARELDPLGSWVPNTAGPGGGLPGGRFDVKRLEEDLEDASMQAMVLSDTLESLDPSMRDPCASSSVVRELARNCRIFQTRLSKLAEEVSDERAIPLIFQTNDEVIRALAVRPRHTT
ncbi:hypothetical protein T484DRAFT_2218481 [Baffinella frigidus]|nr:hypothetical protein T484DRAFT_2218481 [Cryptophyta sp. CCMP2293]